VEIKAPVRDSTRDGSFYLKMEAKTITIEMAREKLGRRGDSMTDQQVLDLLNMLRLICNKTIDAVVEKSDLN